MALRKLVLCSAVALAIFGGVRASPPAGGAAAGAAGRHIYTHPKLGFSLEYSAELKAIEFPNGVALVNDAADSRDRVMIFVTNTAMEDKMHPNMVAAYFDRFRAAEPGEKLKLIEFSYPTYTKVSNLKVDGRPGVKVVHEPEPVTRRSPAASGDARGMPIPDYYSVSVYVRKDGEVWEVMNVSLVRDGLKAGAKTFEEVLKTFKFSPKSSSNRVSAEDILRDAWGAVYGRRSDSVDGE
jgi:hypothetical protein